MRKCIIHSLLLFIQSFKGNLLSQKSKFESFKEQIIDKMSGDDSVAKEARAALRSIEENANALISDVNDRIETGKRVNSLMRGSSSLIESCNGLMTDGCISPFFKQVS